MYGTDENGKKWGKLYTFTTETGDNIDPVTGAKPLNWSESDGVIKILDRTKNREPDIVTKLVQKGYDMNFNLKKEGTGAITTHEFLLQMEYEFNDMINSIETYSGFYIGRYETGDLNKEKVVLKKFNINIGNSQTWYDMYNKCKTLKNKNSNIETGMLWGCQWDRTLMWLIESGNKTKEDICIDSSTWGNNKSSEFEYSTSNGKIEVKKSGIEVRIPTGSSEYTKSNNIYDLVGNVYDWVMEASSNGRSNRGGSTNDGVGKSISRYSLNPTFAASYQRLSRNVIYKIN